MLGGTTQGARGVGTTRCSPSFSALEDGVHCHRMRTVRSASSTLNLTGQGGSQVGLRCEPTARSAWTRLSQSAVTASRCLLPAKLCAPPSGLQARVRPPPFSSTRGPERFAWAQRSAADQTFRFSVDQRILSGLVSGGQVMGGLRQTGTQLHQNGHWGELAKASGVQPTGKRVSACVSGGTTMGRKMVIGMRFETRPT